VRFKRFDFGGDGLELFGDDAVAYFPKWGVASVTTMSSSMR
jgi:hypothetical protein